jgi:hypothetical protein
MLLCTCCPMYASKVFKRQCSAHGRTNIYIRAEKVSAWKEIFFQKEKKYILGGIADA